MLADRVVRIEFGESVNASVDPSGDHESVDCASPLATLSVLASSRRGVPPESGTTKRCTGRGALRSVIGCVVNTKLSRNFSLPESFGCFSSAA